LTHLEPPQSAVVCPLTAVQPNPALTLAKKLNSLVASNGSGQSRGSAHPLEIGKLFLMAPANEKQQAHQLLDQLDAGQLAAVVHLLRVMTGPLSHSLVSAPVEEEEVTPETAAALDRARASLDRGEGIPHEDILREFGLGK
jgi:hypothetical protein